jgi:hypothetical protein
MIPYVCVFTALAIRVLVRFATGLVLVGTALFLPIVALIPWHVRRFIVIVVLPSVLLLILRHFVQV